MNKQDSSDICQTSCFNQDSVNIVRAGMSKEDSLEELAELFKVLSDHTRIRILHALSLSELCVCDLSYILDMGQSAISHQLRVLRTGKIIKKRKEGKMVYYSLGDNHMINLFHQGLEHVKEDN